MANYKKFLYISGLTEGQKLADIKAAGYLNEGGKYFKTIVFAAETNEIYNRGKAYGLSKADAQRITNLEEAQEALSKAQLSVADGDKVLTVTEGTGEHAGEKTISATLSMTYGKKAEGDTKYIFLKGKNNEVISEIDATEFIKDKVVTDAKLYGTEENPVEEGITIEAPYIKMEFSESVDPIRFSVKKLVDIYNAANILLTAAYEGVGEYDATAIKSGASMDTVVAQLVAGIAEAKANAGVTSVGGKTGAITLEGALTENGDINLSIDENGKITATIVGLGTAAFTNVEAYATAEQGETADSAIQEITIAGKTLTKETNTITAAEILEALDLSAYVAKEDVLSAESEGTNFIKVTLGGTKGTPTVSVSEQTKTLEEASETNDGLATAADVKKVITDNEKVHAAALNNLDTRVKALEEDTTAADDIEALDERVQALEEDLDWEEC